MIIIEGGQEKMQKTSVFDKFLVVEIIILFIGIGIQPAFANDTIISNVAKDENNDGLPDLIIEDIRIRIDDEYQEHAHPQELWPRFLLM